MFYSRHAALWAALQLCTAVADRRDDSNGSNRGFQNNNGSHKPPSMSWTLSISRTTLYTVTTGAGTSPQDDLSTTSLTSSQSGSSRPKNGTTTTTAGITDVDPLSSWITDVDDSMSTWTTGVDDSIPSWATVPDGSSPSSTGPDGSSASSTDPNNDLSYASQPDEIGQTWITVSGVEWGPLQAPSVTESVNWIEDPTDPPSSAATSTVPPLSTVRPCPTHRRLHGNGTGTRFSNSTLHNDTICIPAGASTSTSCSSLSEGATATVYSIRPNPTTITLLVTDNYTPTYKWIPDYTQPVYCTSSADDNGVGPNKVPPGTILAPGYTPTTTTPTVVPPGVNPAITTVIVTSKNPVVVYSTVSNPAYPDYRTEKMPGVSQTPGILQPEFPPPVTVGFVGNPEIPTPTTVVVAGSVSVIIGAGEVVINSQTIINTGSATKVTVDGQEFTVNPSQVIAPGTVLAIPTNLGGIFIANPSPTVLPDIQPTKVIILDGQDVSAVGGSVAVIGGSTFTYGPGSPAQTDVVDGQTISIGPGGIDLGSTTLGVPARLVGTQLGVAGGLPVTEIGSTIAVVQGTTFTVGPGAAITTAVINGRTVTAGPGGIALGSTTLTYPFNPATLVITAGGITFSEIGSLVVIGDKTFTFGSGAEVTTDVYNGQTISIGPGGIGFASTTIVPSMPSTTAKHSGKKNAAGRPRPVCGILELCIGIGVLLLI